MMVMYFMQIMRNKKCCQESVLLRSCPMQTGMGTLLVNHMPCYTSYQEYEDNISTGSFSGGSCVITVHPVPVCADTLNYKSRMAVFLF
jgi:hypothetical protein